WDALHTFAGQRGCPLMADFRFAPIENPDTEPFWAGCREGKLLIQRCPSCSTQRHPPSPTCHHCLAFGHDWVEACGRGKVWSYSVVHEPIEGWPGELPNTVVIVALEEGGKIVSNLVGGGTDGIAIDMDVR